MPWYYALFAIIGLGVIFKILKKPLSSSRLPFLTSELIIASINNSPLQEQGCPATYVKHADVFEQAWFSNGEVTVFYEAKYLPQGKIETLELEMPGKARGKYSTEFRRGKWHCESVLGVSPSFIFNQDFKIEDRQEILKAVRQVLNADDDIPDAGPWELECPIA